MRFTSNLNNLKCMEWKINATQGVLFSLLYEAHSWSKEVIIDNKVYYFVSRNLILKELPMFFDKADTVYRNFKKLEEVGVIEYLKKDKMDLIRVTEKGKTWNFTENNSEKNPSIEEDSEKNPRELGKKSENNSEKNPTYKDTNIYNNTINNIYIFNGNEEIRKKFEHFLERRRIALKNISEIQIEIWQKQLYDISNGNEEVALKILENTILGNWNKFFPLKEVKNENGKRVNGRRNEKDRHSKIVDRTNDGEGWN